MQRAGLAVQLELRADAIGTRDEHRILVAETAKCEQTGEAAVGIDHAGAVGRTDGALETLDDGVGRVERDAGGCVGEVVTHRHATGSWVASKRSLSAASGTMVGYSPVRQARQ